jgi:hypothetical protein
VRPALLGPVACLLLLGCSAPPAGDTGAAPAAARSTTAAGSPAAAPASTAGGPTGFAVRLDSEQVPISGPRGEPLLRWRSAWTLTWQPLPDAQGYGVWFGTNEGAGPEPQRTLVAPELRLTAAAGTSPPDRYERERDAGLLFTSSQLLVSVAARTAGGGYGPRSPWYPVGDVPVDGRPVGTALTAHGAGG